MAKEQVSVKLDAEQLAYLEREARREDRTVSALLRHLVAQAARAAAVVSGGHDDAHRSPGIPAVARERAGQAPT